MRRKHYENIAVEEESGVKHRLKVYALENGGLTFTQAVEKLLENQPKK